MKIERIGSEYRTRIRKDSCGDPIIRGRNGHLYTDENGAVMVCFTDDGRDKPFPSKQFRAYRLKMIRPWVKRITQDGEYEFAVEIDPVPEAIKTALFRVLRVKRFMVTKGIPRELPKGLKDWHKQRLEAKQPSLALE